MFQKSTTTLCAVFLFSCYSILLTTSPPSHATYILEDRIDPGQNIRFRWTRDDNPLTATYMIEFVIDGEKRTRRTFDSRIFDARNEGNIPNDKGASFKFFAPKQATDWEQRIIEPPGSGGTRESFVIGGNIEAESPFAFKPLGELPTDIHEIPDLAPAASGGPALIIYAAVDLALYIASNPLGFNNGNWSEGDTLSSLGLEIINGQISGLEGIFWSLTPFEFDASSPWGFTPEGGNTNLLNSADFGTVPIEILQRHIGQNTPEPGSLFLMLAGLPFFLSFRTNSLRRLTRYRLMPENRRRALDPALAA